MPGPRPLSAGRRVVATAPVRVADVGGWTDTWFGSPGQVCSLAVGPGVTVRAELVGRTPGAGPVRLLAPDLSFAADVDPAAADAGEHPLLVHAAASVLERAVVPDDVAVELAVASAVPPGASLGTSATVLVALLGALESLVLDEPDRADPSELARRAHRVETERAGREAGVQDGWAAALGGALDLRIGTYPDVRPYRVDLSDEVRAALDARLVTVVFGAHDSSAVHQQVITAITGCGGADHDRVRGALRQLSSLADQAAVALAHGDLDRWGAVLVAATEAQAQLHPALVGAPHRAAVEVARSVGAWAWKINGAGGDGGSLTVLAGERPGAADRLRAALAAADPTWQLLDLAVAPGVAVEVTEP